MSATDRVRAKHSQRVTAVIKKEEEEDREPESFLLRPDDPLVQEYKRSKVRFKKVVSDICSQDEDKQETVRAVHAFAMKRRSSKIIPK